MPSTLSTAQQQVLLSLAQGTTVTAAAEAAGVHRNTVANWRRTCRDFQQALVVAEYEQNRHWCDQMQSLAGFAVENLRLILTDGTASPHVRLRASIIVLDKVTKAAPAQPDLIAHFHTEEVVDLMSADLDALTELTAASPAPKPAPLKLAQKCTTKPPGARPPTRTQHPLPLRQRTQTQALLPQPARPSRLKPRPLRPTRSARQFPNLNRAEPRPRPRPIK